MERRYTALAWGLFALFVGVSIGWVVLDALNGESALENALYALAYASFGVIGLLIASRRPENSLGWIFLWIGIGANAGNGASAYAHYALVTEPGSLPAGDWAAALGEFLWPVAIMSILLLLVLFPSGRPASRYQRWLLWFGLFGIAALGLGGFLLLPREIKIAPGIVVDNPAGIEAFAGALSKLAMTAVVIPVVAFLSIGALIVQTRRSHGVERQQLKWFGYSALAMVLFNFVIVNIVKTLVPAVRGGGTDLLFIAAFALIPIGTGVAILRYRLYDLERIVNRTLVYSALTTVLGGAYVGLVFLLREMTGSWTRDSDIAVAGSTLAVATMFRPLRNKLQGFIDHRFFRRKYDASHTLQSFAGRLRDEVDLGSLGKELVDVVSETMQPAHASLWLRGNGQVQT